MEHKTLSEIDEILLKIHYGKHWALCGSLVPNTFQLTEDKTKVSCPYCLGLLDKQ